METNSLAVNDILLRAWAIQQALVNVSTYRNYRIVDIFYIQGSLLANFRNDLFSLGGEKMLQQDENLYDLIKMYITKIFDKVNDAIILVDKNGKVVYVNDSYARAVGIDKNRVIGRDLTLNYPNDKLLEVLRSGYLLEDVEHFNKTLGSKIVASYIPLHDISGQVLGVIALGTTVPVYLLSRRLSSFFSRRSKVNSRKQLPQSFANIIGNAPRFLNCLHLAATAAEAECTIMLRGETGVGKEVFAEAIHKASSREKSPFVTVNCAAIPETLLESELFGYVGGAFTGARPSGKVGKFEEASGGTLFLDEIGELPQNMQAKLLRFIQEKYIEKVGGNQKIPINVRIVAATNRNLELMVQQGDFRADLYYRLQVVPIYIPPLRDRPEDIPLLAHHFMDLLSKKYNKRMSFLPETMEFLQEYNWPGNVRELINIVEHTVVMCPESTITLDCLPAHLSGEARKTDFDTLCLDYLVERLEKEVIKKALKKAKNNKSKAIELLGISRSSFYAKLDKYKLSGGEDSY